MNAILLSSLWIGWCALHSLLIDPAVIAAVEGRLPAASRYYRLLYNLLALTTFLPLALVTFLAGGPPVFAWHGWGQAARALLLVAAFLLFWGGGKRYDMRHLLGLTQLRTGQSSLLLTDSPEFAADGVFGMVRHPWYLGSLLLLWSALPEYPVARVLAAVILSCYLVIGTVLEERKIVARYGESYRAYQRRVSMLFPWKWLKKKLS